jgi:hypothetical protein
LNKAFCEAKIHERGCVMARTKKPRRSIAPHAMTDAQCRINPEESVSAAIDAAEEIEELVADEVCERPRLRVDKSNPHKTVATLRETFLQKLAGCMTAVCPSASPSIKFRRARLRR